MKKKEIKVSDLITDSKNFNKGTEFGNSLIEKSLRENGAGRSILLDKHNNIIAGNKTAENAVSIGMDDLIIVESDGSKIIAVKRTDIDLDSPEGRKMALADNATAKANISWDFDMLQQEFEMPEMKEWGIPQADFINSLDTEFTLPDGGKSPFQQMTFTFSDSQAEFIKSAIDSIKKYGDCKTDESNGNENSNGNALYLIVKQWEEQKK